MSRKSKSRTRRNNYKSKSGKYKKVRKTQRKTRRNRRRGGGNFLDKVRRSVSAIKSKGRDLKSKMRTYATDGTWAKQPKKNLEALRDVASGLDNAKDTRLEEKLEKDQQYQKSKRKYDSRSKNINDSVGHRLGWTEEEIKRSLHHAHMDRATASGEMRKRREELAKTTDSIKDNYITSDITSVPRY
jgi:hypothetical protein